MTRRLTFLIALICLATAAPASAQEPIEVVGEQQLSPRLSEYTLRTPALAEETVVRVLVPRGYSEGDGRRYPVLYLLHGCCDYDVRGSQAWTTHGEAEAATDGLDLIVVMPDGGRAGFYTDWFNNGLGGPPRWESYHMGQLVPWVDGRFRTQASREGRVVAGLSMGGFGAMSYAARHPDRFVAAASYSGAVDTNVSPDVFDALTVQDGGTPGAVFGERRTEELRWRAHNPWDIAENLRGLHLEIRAGNGERGELDEPGPAPPDALEQSTYGQSVRFHERLDALGLPHVWDAYGNGTHTWPYWARDLRRTLPEFMRVLADPPPPPERVTYTAAEPEYEVYGWQRERRAPRARVQPAGGRRARRLHARGQRRGRRSPRRRSTRPARPTPWTAPPSSPTTPGACTCRCRSGRATRRSSTGPRPTRRSRGVRVRIAATSAAGATPPPRAVPCASRRRFRLHVPTRLRGKVRATVAGRRVRVRDGGRMRFIVVDLRGRPQGVYRVVLRARRGRVVRSFRTCRLTRP